MAHRRRHGDRRPGLHGPGGPDRRRFGAGAATVNVTVPILGDRIAEDNETLRVLLDTSTGAPIGDGEGVGTITDDDPPTLRSLDVSVAERNSGTWTMTFQVRLSRDWNAPVTAQWATEDGTATAGSDYVAASGSLTIRRARGGRPCRSR